MFMQLKPGRLKLICSLVILMSGIAMGDDEWPQFRGPDGQGHAESADIPVRWSETENVRWKTAVPGEGHSSPVISGNQVWLTTAIARPLSEDEEKARLAKLKDANGLKLAGALSLQAIQIDRETGEIQRQITLFEVDEPEPKHTMNSYASPTPVIAGDQVYFHFGTYGTACVDRTTGAIVWENRDFRIDHQNGPGSSPVIWNDRLLIHFDGTDAQFIAAFDRMTGKVLWKTVRSGEMDPTPELQKAYTDRGRCAWSTRCDFASCELGLWVRRPGWSRDLASPLWAAWFFDGSSPGVAG